MRLVLILLLLLTVSCQEEIYDAYTVPIAGSIVIQTKCTVDYSFTIGNESFSGTHQYGKLVIRYQERDTLYYQVGILRGKMFPSVVTHFDMQCP